MSSCSGRLSGKVRRERSAADLLLTKDDCPAAELVVYLGSPATHLVKVRSSSVIVLNLLLEFEPAENAAILLNENSNQNIDDFVA